MADHHRSSTNKTSLKSVFIGSDVQFNRIQNLVIKMNRLVIHASLFMKMHLLANPDFIFSNPACKGILLLLNDDRTRSDLADPFRASMDAYRALVNFEYERITYFDQLASYHGGMLSTCFLNNIQEHFCQKVKTYCTEFLVKRLRDQVPDGVQR